MSEFNYLSATDIVYGSTGNPIATGLVYKTDVFCEVGKNSTVSDVTYVCAFKFTLPNFAGVSQSLNIQLKIGSMSSEIYDTGIESNYALCTSDSNIGYYVGARSIVSDSNQIMCGTKLLTRTETEFIIETNNLKANNTYYIIFWISSDHISYNSSHVSMSPESIGVTYFSGLLNIDNGTKYDKYKCYIDNGTKFEQYIPYIDNGTTWEQL